MPIPMPLVGVPRRFAHNHFLPWPLHSAVPPVPVPSGWCCGSAGLRCRALATRIGLGGPPQIAVNSAALLGDPCMLSWGEVVAKIGQLWKRNASRDDRQKTPTLRVPEACVVKPPHGPVVLIGTAPQTNNWPALRPGPAADGTGQMRGEAA